MHSTDIHYLKISTKYQAFDCKRVRIVTKVLAVITMTDMGDGVVDIGIEDDSRFSDTNGYDKHLNNLPRSNLVFYVLSVINTKESIP